MALEAVFVLGLLVLGALFALAVEVVLLRGRARRLEEGAATQAHVLAAVQSRPAELGREEQTRPEGIRALLATPECQHAQPFAQGAKPAALAEGEQTEGERPTALPTTPGDVADYSELVAATAAGDVDAEDNEETRLWSSSALTTALEAEADGAEAEGNEETRLWSSSALTTALEAEAGGATRHPLATPRAALSALVAPPASAPPLPSAETVIPAAGLERRPPSGPVAPPPAPLQRTETLLGMPAVRPQEPVGDASVRTSWPTLKQDGGVGPSTPTLAGSAPRGAVPYVSKTLLSMPAQGAAPTSSPSDSAASLPRQEDIRGTFESLTLFEPEPSNAHLVEQEAAE